MCANPVARALADHVQIASVDATGGTNQVTLTYTLTNQSGQRVNVRVERVVAGERRNTWTHQIPGDTETLTDSASFGVTVASPTPVECCVAIRDVYPAT